MRAYATLYFATILVALAAIWMVGVERYQEGRSDERADWVAKAGEQARQNNALLVNESRRGDALTLRVADVQNTLTLFAEEKNREISKLVTGRRCLGAGIVGVLNRPADMQQSGLISATTGVPVRSFAATAIADDDGQWATDADIAWWVGSAQTSYDTCRARLGAIAEYYSTQGEK